MATDFQTSSEPSMAELVGGIVHDAQELIKQEVALARREIADELTKLKQAAISLGVGVGIAVVGGLLLILTPVFFLKEEMLLNWWHSSAIVGGLLVLIGGGLFFFGKARAGQISLVPKQTVETLKENVQWINKPT